MELVKSLNKEVFNVSLVRGYARELRQKFRYLILNKLILVDKCFKE